VKATIAAQVLTRCVLLTLLTASSADVALALDGAVPPRPAASGSKPANIHHKASSFAPHPTRRRVFGDPIPPPLVHKAPPKPR
jgi:hypothetical protein